MTGKMVVTPWEVSGDIDYAKLIKDFGTKPLTDSLIRRIEKGAGESHFMLRRKVFFSHRDMDILLNEHEEGKPWALYTGRGPSGRTHIGHMLPWFFTKYLQDAFKVNLYFQITDDEKFLCKQELSLDETHRLAYDNALDLIALGFDPKRTFIIIDTDYAKTLYKIAIQVAKKVTTSSAKAVFGFTNETNIGMMFWPAMQAAPCFLPSVIEGKPVRTLIPAAIDQDPYWRISRDVAPKLGYPKTAAIHSVFLPSLHGPGKMSTSDGETTTIFTTDTPEQVENKIMKYAFSGGRGSVKEHRERGGIPEVDVSYQWLRILFEPDDSKLRKIYEDYKSGKLLTGELKQILIEKINSFLKKHQEEREKAKDRIDEFLLKD
ncbi:MAG: tryptophan--tRNA ligase [Candidatus Aenigmatarchaeota archaeon]